MKKILFSVVLVVFAVACGDHSNHIGKAVDTQKAVSVKVALKEYNAHGNSDEIVIYGKIAEVCQAEGCWFAYEVGDSTLTVDFNNEFTVPKNIKRKDIYAVGHFYKDTTVTSGELKDSTLGSIKMIVTKFRAHGVKF